MANAGATGIAEQLRDMSRRERMPVADFTAAVVDLFRYAGLSRDDAALAAEVAVHAQLHGSDAHGCVQLPLYITGLIDGTIKSAPQIKTESRLTCCVRMDADHGLGLIIGCRAMDIAVDLANTHGLGAVAVRNSSHFSTAGFYSERAARQGLIGFAFTNASTAIAPTGSKEPLFGTNPIGVGVPLAGNDPIVVDMATSVVARSRIRYMLALGQKTIPEDWALDPDGKPTVDPAVAVKGSVLPIGGPKGYALSLIVELLCSALSDGDPGFQVTYENVVKRPSTISQFFFVINPAGFVAPERFLERAEFIADAARKAKPIDEASPPRLPGARGHAVAQQSAVEGVTIIGNLRHALRSVADLIEKCAP